MNRIDDKKDLAITINTVKNKLTNKKWKYYNGNTTFDYVLAFDNQEYLNISFTEGVYNISDFELYYLDYVHLEKLSSKVDALNSDIEVSKDGYFTISIPYDNGFIVKVDGQDVKTEKVNETFLGFKITKGRHNIDIEYKAPLKDISIVISIIGIIALLVTNFLESKRKI